MGNSGAYRRLPFRGQARGKSTVLLCRGWVIGLGERSASALWALANPRNGFLNVLFTLFVDESNHFLIETVFRHLGLQDSQEIVQLTRLNELLFVRFSDVALL